MSFFTTLGNKIGAVAHSIGQKAKHAIKRGTKFVHDHAKQVEDVAGAVSSVAGTLATGAAMVGLEPVAGVLGGVAAGAKGVQKVAGMLDTADKFGGAVGTAIGAARRGDAGRAVAAGKNAAAQAKLLNARRKAIQR
tara:strand:- start:813 stop:1220 length:408 start_codon:yes stop_codon:yes gene_type:complete